MSFRLITTTAVVIALGLATGAASAQAAEIEGTVVAKNAKARTFSVKQDEGAGIRKVKVNSSTTYDRLSGFGAIRVGLKNVDVTARKNAKGRWVAAHVELSGKDGGGGDDD
jgi:hypothetical protein